MPWCQEKDMAQHHTHDIETAESNGGSLDADLEIVRFIHHGIFGIVSDDPKQVSRHQYPGNERHLAGLRGKSHGNTEAESNAEIACGMAKKRLVKG